MGASKSVEESCTCVEAISAENVTAMQVQLVPEPCMSLSQKCDASKDNSAALKAKKACKAAVGKCKTAEVTN